MQRPLAERLLFPPQQVNETKLAKAVNGKTIVVSGASFGIGHALCLLLSRYDTHLVLIARTEEAMSILAKSIEANGSRATIIVADLYQIDDAEAVLARLATIGAIDIFISNAGKSIMRPLVQSLARYQDITRTNSLNYLAPVKILLGLTPLLTRSKGMIINVSALNVLLLPAPNWAAYQASKTAFDQWFRCNWAEWKQLGITAKSIYFPLVKTRMIAPNPKYTHAPAMEVQQAAIRIAKLIYQDKSVSKPWWAIFPQTAGFLASKLWNAYSFHHISRHSS
ncbi:epimerase [Taibaiella sp. KBW10]|uniref:SDR family NAD(P)-dependent oxidoreductase n=1 Tax=Taibaiella sp. KBW10 TaxID=2153357 RepID=UPI000F599E44|nr:SDR family NAD(P)-dependent oxidoreductase [Taibaiella sp. KBW10]RQO32402.1 epimerase [Taibaiella sp. KBW10]